MAKKRSQLEKAILQIEDDIAALELARNHLIRQRPATPRAKPTPRPAPPPVPPRAMPRPVPEETAS